MTISINKSLKARHLGTRSGSIVGIVLHDTAGSGKHNDTLYLANPSDGRIVSTDFTVERDGSVWQLNPDLTKYCTYHAGRKTNFKGLQNAQVTRRTIGIEIVQKADLSLSPTYTPEQIRAVGQLCAHLAKEFSLKADDITTHSKIISDGSRSDPRRFPFATFWLIFHQLTGSLPERVDKTPSEPIPASVPVYYTVRDGDNLTKVALKFKEQYGTTVDSLKKLNKINDPRNIIRVGQKLRIR